MEDRGFEPLISPPQSTGPKQDTDKCPEPLAYSLARKTENDRDLARIVDAWPSLPEPIRRAMLALVESGRRDR